jgi:hypothetical protein
VCCGSQEARGARSPSEASWDTFGSFWPDLTTIAILAVAFLSALQMVYSYVHQAHQNKHKLKS